MTIEEAIERISLIQGRVREIPPELRGVINNTYMPLFKMARIGTALNNLDAALDELQVARENLEKVV